MRDPSFREIRNFNKNKPTVAPGMEDSPSTQGGNMSSVNPFTGLPNNNQVSRPRPVMQGGLTRPGVGAPVLQGSMSVARPSVSAPGVGRPSYSSVAPGAPGVNPRLAAGIPNNPTGTPNNPAGASTEQVQAAKEARVEQMKVGALTFFKASMQALGSSLTRTSKYTVYTWASKLMVFSGVMAGLGFIMTMVHIGLPRWCGGGPQLMLAGLGITLTSSVVWACTASGAKKQRMEYLDRKNGGNKPNPTQFSKSTGGLPSPAPMPSSMPSTMPSFIPAPSLEKSPVKTPFLESNDDEDEEEEEDWDDEEEDWSIDEDYEEEEEDSSRPMADPDKVLEEMPEITQGMYSRQYLLEQYMKVLPLEHPDFSKPRVIDEESNEFDNWGELVKEALKQVGITSGGADEGLESVEETLSTYSLKINRTQKVAKSEAKLANEILNTYKIVDGRIDPNRASASVSYLGGGSNLWVKILKGNSYVVTIGDIYQNAEVRKWLLDTKVVMPWVYGTSESGEIHKGDFAEIDSSFFAGKARSGKSFAVHMLLLQMCMWTSPKDLRIEIFDAKGLASEYYKSVQYETPHYVGIHSDVTEIVGRLQEILHNELPYRKKVLADYGVNKIQDLKKDHPEVELPYLYLVFDELQSVMTTAQELNLQKEFVGYLRQVVTESPAYGIRVILVPHAIRNDNIPKSVSDLVQARAAVRAEKDSLDAAVGVTNFPYTLANKGDTAMKNPIMNSGSVFYSHAAIIALDSKDLAKFDMFLSNLWKRLEPDVKLGYWGLRPSKFADGRAWDRLGTAEEGQTSGQMSGQTSGASAYPAGIQSAPVPPPNHWDNPAETVEVNPIPPKKEDSGSKLEGIDEDDVWNLI